jgi:hypothetical protein
VRVVVLPGPPRINVDVDQRDRLEPASDLGATRDATDAGDQVDDPCLRYARRCARSPARGSRWFGSPPARISPASAVNGIAPSDVILQAAAHAHGGLRLLPPVLDMAAYSATTQRTTWPAMRLNGMRGGNGLVWPSHG